MRRAALAALTLAAAAGIHPAPAQDLPVLDTPARTLTTTVSQSFEVDTNYDLDDPSPGTSYFTDTRVELGLLNQTRTGSFALGLDAGLRALWRAEQDFEFVAASPSGGYLTYGQEGANTLFDADVRVRSRRVDFRTVEEFDIDDPGAVPDDLSALEGDTRELRYDADVGLTLGTTSPSTYEFRLRATGFDYSDTTGTRLIPRQTVEGEALWTLRLTPILSGALFGSYLYYTDDDEDELRVAEADAGVVYQPDETLRLRAGLGYADREREEVGLDGTRTTTQSDAGPTARGDIRYVLPSFTVVGDARVTAAAPDPRLSGNLRAVYALPRGSVVGRVFQSYTGGREGAEERIAGAGVGLIHNINNVSRIGLDFEVAKQSNQDDPDVPDINRTDVTATYAYDVTAAVSAELGYGFRLRTEDPEEADSHRVFFVIGRTFETGL